MTIPLPAYQVESQRGVALIVSLVMLVAITLIGVFVMSNSRLEWLMTSNSRFQADAFMQAEATLVLAEAAIPNDPATISSWGDPFYRDDLPSPNPNALPADPNQTSNWGSYKTSASGISAPSGTENNYVIDYLGCNILTLGNSLSGCGGSGNKSIFTYRVWSRSTNGKGSVRIIQSVYTITLSPQGASGLKPTRTRTGFAQVSS